MESDVSVVICAYTEARWVELCAAVESVRRQTVLPKEIVVVIDHNPALLKHVRETMPEVVAIENQAAQGASGSRNTGAAVCQGSRIAFLDDDAVAEPDWLLRLNAWCDQPDVLGAGGKVEPMWQGEKPAWFPEEFYWVVGCSYRGLPLQAARVRNLFGGAMCLRREVLLAGGGFSSGLGRVGTLPVGCEETELCIRAGQRWPQGKFIYEPLAVIRHQVPTSRTSWAYFQLRCYAEGQSKAYMVRLVGGRDGLSTERGYTFRTLPLGVLQGIWEVFSQGSLAGFSRAGAVIAGLAFTAFGYLMGLQQPHKVAALPSEA